MNDSSDSRAGDQASMVRYGVLAWLCSLSMLTYIDRVCIKTVGNDMQADLGLTPQQFGWVFSAFGLAYALFEVPSGWLGDLFGPRKVLARIVLWWSLFTALTGCIWPFILDSGYRLTIPWIDFLWDDGNLTWSTTSVEIPLLLNGFVLLLIIRFLFGAGEAGAYPNSARALRNWFPYSRRGLAQGLLWMFGRWGGAFAPMLIASFAWWFGWRGAFVAFGVVGALWVIAFFTWFRDTPEEHPSVNEAERVFIRGYTGEPPKPAPISWKTMLSSPTLWWLSGMYFCSNAGWCFFITWDVKYYETVLDLKDFPLQIASGAPLFFGGIACILGGFLTDRQVRIWGRRWGRTLQGFAAYLLGATFFLLALLTREPWLAVPSLCMASFMKDFAMAVSWSTCIDIGHRYSGTVAGFMNMVGNLGTFVSPPLVAWMAGRGQWDMALVYSAAVFTIAAVCWLFINPRRVIVYAPADHERLRAEGALE
jgi:MFS transporter, ACS family, glucarate transporter